MSALFYWLYIDIIVFCVCTRQSGSSVPTLRVLTFSIESSWQLKGERKIGKWGGVSMLRPLPPHSSLAEDVWMYSGNATFERSQWEGSSFLLYVWIPSSGVSLSDAVQQGGREQESGLGCCTVPCFYYTCMSLYAQGALCWWAGWKIAKDMSWLSLSTYRMMYFVMRAVTGLLYRHTSVVYWGPLFQYHRLIWKKRNPLVVFPASQTPCTRQPGQERLMQTDRHADGHRDTWMCGQVAWETEGQVGADRGG